MRIFYCAGPGDLIGTYRHYLKGEPDPGQVAVTYSSQFFDVCREFGLRAKVVTVHPRAADSFAAERVEIVNWPSPWMRRRKFGYYLGSLGYHLRLIAAILAFRAKVVVHFDFIHWFLLAPVAWLGVKVIPTIHCRLWTGDAPAGRVHGLVMRLNGWYFRRCVVGVMCVSDEIARQVREIAGEELPIVVFFPSYPPGTFDVAPEADPPGGTERRRILFVGRVEASKGAFDLVDVAAMLRDRGCDDLVFDVCGDGGALAEMKAMARARGVEDRFVFRGYVDRDRLPSIFRSSFAVIVPTRSEFAEGFNKVVAEGVLAGKPVMTSPTCPAIESLGDAVLVVPADDPRGYADAIQRLRDDRGFYDAIVRAGDARRGPFHDPDAGWAHAFRTLLLRAVPALRGQNRGEAAGPFRP
ncbi:glycosyltransferase family 4 protein [Paludisphaera soli]|uniref:glycosyltransferase family 4 protein n=1 Tax=Paludisphaera soli TaxID=2712865 RepID=UPI0013EB80BD|nr:glycosyltransferase family 4 protein [Paludisphaera soli]